LSENDVTLPRDSDRGQSPVTLAILWIAFVAADGAAQLLFKSAAAHLPEPSLTLQWVLLTATSLRAWAALGCLVMVFCVWMVILRRLPLATAFPMTASTYVVVVAASQVVYGERIAAVQYLGVALIVVGVALMRPAR
jgi:drug/metabolite transporter (DMT)-like permease